MGKHDESDSDNEAPGGSGGGTKPGGGGPKPGGGGGGGGGEAGDSPHAAGSSERGGEGGGEGKIYESGVVAADQVAESFDGAPKKGEFESLEGFDPTRALNEGEPFSFLTDEI